MKKRGRIVLTGVGGDKVANEPRHEVAMTDLGVWMRQVGSREGWRFIPWDEVYFGSRAMRWNTPDDATED